MDDVDDDFGDLYADVELQSISVISTRLQAEPGSDGEPSKSTDSGPKKVDLSIQDDDIEVKGDSSGKANDDSEVRMDYGSDSEDDFNIVLNDDDDSGGGLALSRGVNPIGVVADEDENENENGCFEVLAGGDEPERNWKSGNQSLHLGDGSEKVTDGIGKKGIVAKGSYQLQYKYMRSHTDPVPTYSKANGPVRMTSTNAAAGRANRGDEEVSPRMASSPLVCQIEQSFSLPRHR